VGNGHIFISYRRDDSGGYARAIYDQLIERFPKERVFMDVDAIEPGLPFDEAIQRAVGGCEILLALIGRRWMEPQGRAGPRLNQPNDYVRAEIAAALSRNVRVIPVLLDGASMPAEETLPEPLRPLARRNAIEVSHSRFDSDVNRLVEAIGLALGERDASTTVPSRRARKAWLLGLAAGFAVLTAWLLFISPRVSKPSLYEATRAKADTVSPPSRVSTTPSSTETHERAELADLVTGTYFGAVSADSKGPSQSDVTVTITKVNKRRVRITSDYARLDMVEVDLTRSGDNLIMGGNGPAVLLLYLDRHPPQLTYNPGDVAYGGEKQ
jgi:hypothetical protein